jgi:hypothetical protein
MAWGEEFVKSVAKCITGADFPDYPVYLITDQATPTECLPDSVNVVRRDLKFAGKLAKVELMGNLPDHLETVLFLDVDTEVLADISLGFDKAEKYGVAMAAAPHYSMENFRNFGVVMDRVGIPRKGQLLYNSGVIFFEAKNPKVQEIFDVACSVAEKDDVAPWGDQTYLSLAMEMLDFNPYTLSGSYNHRGFGELISGSLRIWHSYNALPSNARQLEPGYLHRHEKGVLVKAMRVPL